MDHLRRIAARTEDRVSRPTAVWFSACQLHLFRGHRDEVCGGRHRVTVGKDLIILRSRSGVDKKGFPIGRNAREGRSRASGRRIAFRGNAGQESWANRRSPGTLAGNLSSEGSLIMFPSASLGSAPRPIWPRYFPSAKRTRAWRTFRGTISKYSFRAGLDEEGGQPFPGYGDQ